MTSREKALEATRRWREKNRELANALARASQKTARDANPAKHRAEVKRWREANKERHAAAHLAWRVKNRERLRNYSRTRYHREVYGLDDGDYERLLELQGGHCALCSRTPDQERHGKLVVDHDHAKKKGDHRFVRGLLCDKCNIALGRLGDNEAGLLNALTYVRGVHAGN